MIGEGYQIEIWQRCRVEFRRDMRRVSGSQGHAQVLAGEITFGLPSLISQWQRHPLCVASVNIPIATNHSSVPS